MEEDRIKESLKGNYAYAEELRLKIEELKNVIDITQKRELSRKHQLQMNQLEELYKKEFEELVLLYGNKFSELEAKSHQMEENLNIKQQNEMGSLYESLDEKLSKKVKYSKKYLDLESQEKNLAKQQKYKEAILVKKLKDEIEIEDTKRFNKYKTDKIKRESLNTANKHIFEKNLLKKKIESEYEELKKDKEREVQILVLKFKNKKSELELQQKMESHIKENKNLFKQIKLF